MLSFIYRLVHEFEREHGRTPNLLFISPFHLDHLRTQLSRKYATLELRHLLGMEIIVADDIVHPHVEWHLHGRQRKAG